MEAVVPSGNVDADAGMLPAAVHGSRGSGDIAKCTECAGEQDHSSFL